MSWLDKKQHWFAALRLFFGTIYTLNFIYCCLVHIKIEIDNPGSAKCITVDGVNHPITPTQLSDPNQITDMSQILYRVNIAGIFVNLLLAVQAVFCIFAPRVYLETARKTTGLVLLTNLIFLCVATYARFCHGGKVCSGDYLYSGVD